MSVISIDFLIFTAVVLVLYWCVPYKFRWIVLLGAGIFFYAASDYRFFPFVLFTSFTTWTASKYVDREAGHPQNKRKALLVAVIILNIAILVLGKLLNYLAFGHYIVEVKKYAILPFAISYYTFTSLGYLLDVYWKKYESESNYLRFLSFVLFFPHITQGPISTYNNLGQELKLPKKTDFDSVIKGLELILWGVFKKLVIAERLSIFVNEVFSLPDRIGAIYFYAVVFDVFYIYSDFSGYMDIMTGISECMGIRLEPNFDHPFFSRSIAEFWRRWHMSLGAWFRRYVYYPLSNSRAMKAFKRKYRHRLPSVIYRLMTIGIPLMITWMLTGLWHGSGAGYLAWGIYYGVLITVSVVFEEQFNNIKAKLHIKTECLSYHLLQMLKVFIIFCGGRLLTKCGAFKNALEMIKNMLFNLSFEQFSLEYLYSFGLNDKNHAYAWICIFIMIFVSALQTKYNIRAKLYEQNIWVRWIVISAGLFGVILLGVYGTAYSEVGFAYQMF